MLQKYCSQRIGDVSMYLERNKPNDDKLKDPLNLTFVELEWKFAAENESDFLLLYIFICIHTQIKAFM